MPVVSVELQQALNVAHAALGPSRSAGNFTLVIDGLEASSLLITQFPVPIVSTTGEPAEVPVPGGGHGWEVTSPDTRFQGAIAGTEKASNALENLMKLILARGGKVDAKLLDGTLDAHRGGKIIRGLMIKLDPADSSTESRNQLLNFTGTAYFSYYGETITPNLV